MSGPPTLSRSKRIAFHLVLTLGGTALLLGALEGVARLLPTREDPYLALKGRISFFSRVEIGGREFFEVTHPDSVTWGGTRFPVEKAPGTRRVFVLGGSAAAGWPHPSSQTFSAYLEAYLRRGGTPVEVLNVSGHGFASYRVRDVFEDVLELEPDLMILWSGNNELFEDRSYPRWFGLDSLLRHSHLVRDLSGLRTLDSFDGRRRDNTRSRHAASTKILREPHHMRADPAEFAAVERHYAFSISEMLDAAESRGVPVLVLTVPVNLRDWWPHVSHHRLPEGERAAWQSRFDAGHGAWLAGRPREAIEALEAALALEPEHARTHFLLARSLEAAGDDERAAEHYRLASDLDYSPLRAHSDLNAALRELATGRPKVTLLDLASIFQQHAEGAAPGFDLFLDYVHPTRAGNLLAAQSVFTAMRDHGLLDLTFIPVDDGWPEVAGSYSDRDDSGLQARLFLLSLAMHQHEAAALRGRPLLEQLRARPELMDLPAFRRNRLTERRLAAMVDENDWYMKMERRKLRGASYRADYEEGYEKMLIDIFERFGVIEEPALRAGAEPRPPASTPD